MALCDSECRRRAEQQYQAAPEHPEGGEHQQPEQAAHLQHALARQQVEHRAEQLPVGQPQFVARRRRQYPPEQQAEPAHARCRDQVDAAPAAEVGEQPGQAARQQQADHHAALRRADHPPALARRRQRRGVGQQSLGHGGAEQAQSEQPQRQAEGIAGEAHQQQRQHQQQELDEHQSAPLQQVAQRHHQQQRQGATGLGRAEQQADPGLADGELGTEDVQQRLGVIDVGHAETAGDGEQQHQRGGEGGWRGWHAKRSVRFQYETKAEARNFGFKMQPKLSQQCVYRSRLAHSGTRARRRFTWRRARVADATGPARS